MLLRLDVYTESLLLSGANLALAKRSLGNCMLGVWASPSRSRAPGNEGRHQLPRGPSREPLFSHQTAVPSEFPVLRSASEGQISLESRLYLGPPGRC